MTAPRTDGGPALPSPDVYDASGCGIREGAVGMSLRDWFAAQALAGIGVWTPLTPGGNTLYTASKEGMQARAEFAYAQADAMLKAREP